VGISTPRRCAPCPRQRPGPTWNSCPGSARSPAPFVVSRALGHTDCLVGTITGLNDTVGRLYDLDHPAATQQLADISAVGPPWRTGAQLPVRSVTPRLANDTAR